jgi:hydrogenase expression/formation protein HypC
MCLGIPGRVTETFECDGLKMGKVDFGGVIRDVCLEYVLDVGVDDYVIVHVGFAINVLNEEEAQESLALLRELGEIEAELGPAE